MFAIYEFLQVTVPVPYVVIKEVNVTVPVIEYVTVPHYLQPGQTAPTSATPLLQTTQVAAQQPNYTTQGSQNIVKLLLF